MYIVKNWSLKLISDFQVNPVIPCEISQSFSKTWNCLCQPGVDRSKRNACKERHAYTGKHALKLCSAVSSINSNRECSCQVYISMCACLLWDACFTIGVVIETRKPKQNMRILHIEIYTWHEHSLLELIENTALHLCCACFPGYACLSLQAMRLERSTPG